MSIFDEAELDISGFAPKTASEPDSLPAESVRAVSEASRFPSREPKATRRAAEPVSKKHVPRVYRTGRSVPFNCKTTQVCHDGMYAIADQQNWKIGETFEKAYEALKRELEGQGTGKTPRD